MVRAAEATSAASSLASFTLPGFIFQFPAMITVRVRAGWDTGWDEVEALGVEIAAEATPDLLRGEGQRGSGEGKTFREGKRWEAHAVSILPHSRVVVACRGQEAEHHALNAFLALATTQSQ